MLNGHAGGSEERTVGKIRGEREREDGEERLSCSTRPSGPDHALELFFSARQKSWQVGRSASGGARSSELARSDWSAVSTFSFDAFNVIAKPIFLEMKGKSAPSLESRKSVFKSSFRDRPLEQPRASFQCLLVHVFASAPSDGISHFSFIRRQEGNVAHASSRLLNLYKRTARATMEDPTKASYNAMTRIVK